MLRRLVHPGSTPDAGPLQVVVAPIRSLLQPQVKGLADLEPVELHRATRRTSTTSSTIWPRPPTRASTWSSARRVRRARRHHRRLPAHRGPPAAHRVLRRRGRRDPALRRRRPADDRAGRPRLGAAVPRAAADRRGPRPRPRAGGRAPRAGRDLHQAVRGPRRRGHGVADARARRRDGAVRRPAPPGLDRRRLRPRADPGAGARPRRHQRGVPAGVVGRGRRRREGADRPRLGGVLGSTTSAWRPSPRAGLVVHLAVLAGRGSRYALDEGLGRSTTGGGGSGYSTTGEGYSTTGEGFERFDADSVDLPIAATPPYRGEAERALADIKGWRRPAPASCSSPPRTARRSAPWSGSPSTTSPPARSTRSPRRPHTARRPGHLRRARPRLRRRRSSSP